MADKADAPTFNPHTRTLKQQHDGYQITVVEDDAGCVSIDIAPLEPTPRPLRVAIAGKELHNTHPEGDELQARVKERAPHLRRKAQIRQVRSKIEQDLPPGATRDDIIAAALDAAAGVNQAVEEES